MGYTPYFVHRRFQKGFDFMNFIDIFVLEPSNFLVFKSTMKAITSEKVNQGYYFNRRRNAVVFNQDLTCTTIENGLHPHILAINLDDLSSEELKVQAYPPVQTCKR